MRGGRRPVAAGALAGAVYPGDMPVDMLVSRRPDSTDLVLRAGGGSRLSAVGLALAAAWTALVVPLALCVPTLLVALWMSLAGVDGGRTGTVVAVIAGLEYLVGWPVMAALGVREVRRVEFAPADVPDSLRLVRGGRPDAWLPLAVLEKVRLTLTVVHPAPGDPRPPVATLELHLDLPHGAERLAPIAPGTDPHRLAAALEELLAPAGIPVKLRTERSTRVRARRNDVWTSGGSASAGSGGG
jgi:hypothetical protein